MARELASVKRIKEINPIEGATNIVRATIEGFDVVVRKDEFKVNDLCLYCETDSILPKNTDFAFLEGKPIKIKKLRGVYSYGIAFPLSVLDKYSDGKKFEEGDDVTDLLGVTKKMDEVIPLNNNSKKNPFPSWIPKTDETRFQNIIDILGEYEGVPCIVTEKLDGSSTTHWLDNNGKYHIATRNQEVLDETSVYYRAGIDNNIPELLKNLPEGSVVQGELIGPGVQKNIYKLDKHEIYMFNLRLDKGYIDADKTLEMLKQAGFKTVPVVHDVYKLIPDKDELLNLSMGKSKLNNKQHREGIVIRSTKLIKVNRGLCYFVDGRLSFKVINPKYELALK